MSNKLMTGFWRYIFMIPPFLWEKRTDKMKKKIEKKFGYMTEEHRMIHHYVVKELPGVWEPLSPKFAAKELELSHGQVKTILDDLEKKKLLVRNNDGKVPWAYPVTVEKTPTTSTSVPVSYCMLLERLTHLRRPSCKGDCLESRCRCLLKQNAHTVVKRYTSKLTMNSITLLAKREPIQ